MEFAEAMRIKKAICEGQDSCEGCWLNERLGDEYCDTYAMDHPEEFEKLLEEWEREHPTIDYVSVEDIEEFIRDNFNHGGGECEGNVILDLLSDYISDIDKISIREGKIV